MEWCEVKYNRVINLQRMLQKHKNKNMNVEHQTMPKSTNNVTIFTEQNTTNNMFLEFFSCRLNIEIEERLI